MSAREGTYDPRVLQGLRVALTMREEESVPAVEVTLDEVTVDDVLASPIQSMDGRCLLGAGHVLTQPLLAKLQNYKRTTGIQEPFQIRLVRRERGSAA